MKVSKETKFVPITITLESQDEVDKLFALLNNAIISSTLEIDGWSEAMGKRENISSKYQTWHDKLSEIIK